MSPYRESVALAPLPQWTTPWTRFVVQLKRGLPWTLAARRQSWRAHCRYLEELDTAKVGTERITITATGNSVVKNVYVNHGQLSMHASAELYVYRRRGHSRMPLT